MLTKQATAPVISSSKRVQVDNNEVEKTAIGIVKCASCGNVYLASHSECPNCAK